MDITFMINIYQIFLGIVSFILGVWINNSIPEKCANSSLRFYAGGTIVLSAVLVIIGLTSLLCNKFCSVKQKHSTAVLKSAILFILNLVLIIFIVNCRDLGCENVQDSQKTNIKSFSLLVIVLNVIGLAGTSYHIYQKFKAKKKEVEKEKEEKGESEDKIEKALEKTDKIKDPEKRAEERLKINKKRKMFKPDAKLQSQRNRAKRALENKMARDVAEEVKKLDEQLKEISDEKGVEKETEKVELLTKKDNLRNNLKVLHKTEDYDTAKRLSDMSIDKWSTDDFSEAVQERGRGDWRRNRGGINRDYF